ncbi:WcbI family polysaccharide biosynthesis putative acetyltransferase [Rhodococcoides kyotonense]|uniref:Polysaccharide biosynthesis enzyme WcbI domain-containing protein n=1 Tax=Rhodococcoides kyotonense TaxID=398843 RepID=A0A239MHJ1_9NOCA|nr:WcbI family polysaccharide biosynthesis putative acetyltransferase [Rhodococcus kyotonensis]SNT42111.1 hypothetical protein SAMN05421642_11855 [Rhodococcus kyotonensis]
MRPPSARTLHYGEFYSVSEASGRDDRPALVVWGNCQAEALRIVLSSASDLPYRTVRVPPVHELLSEDLPYVQRLLGDAAVIVSQPVRAGYRGLPIGTADIVDVADPKAKTIVWPVIRYGGLFPFQVIVRSPDRPSAVPAAVPYHDLRTLLAVRDGRTGLDGWDVDVTPEQIRAAARWSVEQLSQREREHCDVAISNVLIGLGDGAAHTINHPGNAVLMTLGRRVLDVLGASEPSAPDRELLGNLRAPLDIRVVEALGLDAAPRERWTVEGHSLSEDDVRIAQIAWYADHPEFIDAALARYGELLEILGMTV